MIILPQMLLIGGATRNVGKTAFSASIIKKISSRFPVVGIKIKTVYPDDDLHHGKGRDKDFHGYKVDIQKELSANEDTDRFIKAGCKMAIKLKAENQYLDKAILSVLKGIDENCLIVCESNSLRDVVDPALFILIKMKDSSLIKPSAKRLEKFADLIVLSDGKSHDFDTEKICVQNGSWIIR